MSFEQSSQRPKRMTQTSTRLSGYEVYTDNVVTDEGDLVHDDPFVDIKPVNHEQIEEMIAIERNKTWEKIFSLRQLQAGPAPHLYSLHQGRAGRRDLRWQTAVGKGRNE